MAMQSVSAAETSLSTRESSEAIVSSLSVRDSRLM